MDRFAGTRRGDASSDESDAEFLRVIIDTKYTSPVTTPEQQSAPWAVFQATIDMVRVLLHRFSCLMGLCSPYPGASTIDYIKGYVSKDHDAVDDIKKQL